MLIYSYLLALFCVDIHQVHLHSAELDWTNTLGWFQLDVSTQAAKNVEVQGLSCI